MTATLSTEAHPPSPGARSFGGRITERAAEHPEKVAFIAARQDGRDESVTWAELERAANQTARLLEQRGTTPGSTVVVAMRFQPAHVYVTVGTWKLGARILPLRWDLPAWERDQLLELVSPSVVVAEWTDHKWAKLAPDELAQAAALDDTPLPDLIAEPPLMLASGGSTGRPKIIVPTLVPEVMTGVSLRATSTAVPYRTGQVQLVPAPPYHTNGFRMAYMGLLEADSLVLLERFDAARVVDLIERYRVNSVVMVPIMLQRVAQLPGVRERDFSSIEAVLYGGAPIPEWLARFWIDLVGPEHFYFSYGSTEGFGIVSMRGDDWLKHPGATGRGVETDVRILGPDGEELPPGEVGEIYLRSQVDQGAPSFYLGAPPAPETPDGFRSIGDLGWLDDDGYLFVADRRTDMIISGGANVFPAEVEAALTEHAAVRDTAVVGVPDEEWGQRVHAVIEPVDVEHPPTAEELAEHCRARLARYKVPKTFEFVPRLPRTDAGKINRSALAEQARSATSRSAS